MRFFQDYNAQKIIFGAVLSTTGKKCCCNSHFAKNCLCVMRRNQIPLIPDEKKEKEESKSAEFEKPDLHRNSRKRKVGKNKKKQRDKSSDFEGSDSESDTGKRARHNIRRE